METLTKAKEYEKVSLTQKEAREENRAIGIQEMDERNSHGPKRIVIKPEQRPGMALGNTSTTGVQSAKRPGGAGMVPGEAEKTERLNTSPYAFGAIPENQLLRIKGHSKIKCAVKLIGLGANLIV